MALVLPRGHIGILPTRSNNVVQDKHTQNNPGGNVDWPKLTLDELNTMYKNDNTNTACLEEFKRRGIDPATGEKIAA